MTILIVGTTMKLKLHENIKRLRKEKNLTQEKLAEILGVTVGAVSKWENGNNTPDIVMLTMLASFFDVSIDVLLGYDMASKKAEKIVENINLLVSERRFDEAEKLSRDAMSRYPHDFSVIYAAADVYYVKALENQDKEDALKAIDLLTKSLEYLSQNKDPDINDFIIRSRIAYSYMVADEKAAFERFKQINFGGIHDTVLALLCIQNNEVDQALNYSTLGIINHLNELIDSTLYMIMSLASKGGKKNLDEAVCLADTMIEVIAKFAGSEPGCYEKYMACYHVLKAYLYGCSGDENEMKKSLSEGKKLAESYDKNGTNDVARHLKFYHAEKKHYHIFDSIGENAVTGFSAALLGQIVKMGKINRKVLNRIIDDWEKEK